MPERFSKKKKVGGHEMTVGHSRGQSVGVLALVGVTLPQEK